MTRLFGFLFVRHPRKYTQPFTNHKRFVSNKFTRGWYGKMNLCLSTYFRLTETNRMPVFELNKNVVGPNIERENYILSVKMVWDKGDQRIGNVFGKLVFQFQLKWRVLGKAWKLISEKCFKWMRNCCHRKMFRKLLLKIVNKAWKCWGGRQSQIVWNFTKIGLVEEKVGHILTRILGNHYIFLIDFLI